MNIIGYKHRIIELMAFCGILSKRNKKSALDSSWSLKPIIPTESLLNISSTNNIIELWINEKKYYLRLIDKHVKRKEYFTQLLYKYECLIDRILPDVFKKQVIENSALFMHMGYIDDFSSPIYNFFKSGNLKLFGIEIDKTLFSSDDFKAFMHFAWSEVATYRKNEGCGFWQTYNYNRCRCQESLYKVLGIERLICETTLVKVKIGGYECLGYLMKDAVGENPLYVNKDILLKLDSCELSRELDILNLMDVICYERDHRPGNYNIIYDSSIEKYSTVQAFDNDSDFAFFPTVSIGKSFVGTTPIISRGVFNKQSLINTDVIKRIISIKDERVRASVEPYLNRLQTFCLLKRLHKIQDAINAKLLSDSNGKDKNKKIAKSPNSHDYYYKLQNWDESNKDTVLLSQQRFDKIKMNPLSISLWMANNHVEL